MNYIGYHGYKCFKNPNKIVEKYVCSHCNTTCFDKPQFLKNHEDNCRFNKNGKKYHPLKINICNKCNKICTNSRGLLKHLKVCKHSENSLKLPNNLYKCTHCNEVYDDLEYFKNNHMDNCDKNPNSINYKPIKEKLFKCEHCDKSYVDKHGLQKHITTNHTSNMQKNICGYCNKEYSNFHELKRHIRNKHL